jgi:hypothetical protein
MRINGGEGMSLVDISKRWAWTSCACVLFAVGVSRADPLAAEPTLDTVCAGAPDGTQCDDNGDGCFFNDGKDHCLAGECKSPPPCARTTFEPLPAGKIQLDWAKDPKDITPGEFCEGNGFVTSDAVREVTGITPPSENGLVSIIRPRKNRKNVPPTGKVRLRLRLNHLGRLMYNQSSTGVQIIARMTLTKPNGMTVGANRTMNLLRRRR